MKIKKDDVVVGPVDGWKSLFHKQNPQITASVQNFAK
jgi:hypothetical protein